MPGIDQDIYQNAWQAGLSYPASVLLASGGLITRSSGTPSATAGTNNGTSPPAPTLAAGSTDGRGSVLFGSGSTPAAGDQVNVSFSQAYSVPPMVVVELVTAAAATVLGVVGVAAVTTSGFRIRSTAAPTASQPGTTYEIAYRVLP